MTAKDRWSQKFYCKVCNKFGEATFWQEDGWSYMNGDRSTHLDSITDGFKWVPTGKTKGDKEVVCSKCDVEVSSRK